MHSFALALVLPALAATTLAQEPGARPAEKPAAKAPFVFEPGVVELRTVIERCGTYLQRNILVDDSELSVASGQPRPRQQRPPAPAGAAPAAADVPTGPFVDLQLPVVTDRDGCEELLTSLLWTRGLTLVPLDEAKGVYEVLSMHGQRARELLQRAVSRTPAEVLTRPRLRQWALVAMNLKHINATIATNALRPFFSMGSQQSPLVIGNAGTTSTVLLCGPQDSVAGAILVLQTADVVQSDVNMELQTRTEQLSKQTADLAARMEQLELMRQRIAAMEKKVTELSTGK